MLIFIMCLIAVMPLQAQDSIEDNSFILEEAFNQEANVYQFIQKYQAGPHGNIQYLFENEIPITDKVHQFSYALHWASEDSSAALGDMILSYRLQPINRKGFLVADRVGLILPTGNVEKGHGSGVVGMEFVHAMSLSLNEDFMNHWNIGFSLLPKAKVGHVQARGNHSIVSAGTSIIYLMNDRFNLMLEGLLASSDSIDGDGKKVSDTSFILNPGMRMSFDFDEQETQIVPGISFPMDLMNQPAGRSVLFYLSIEPRLE